MVYFCVFVLFLTIILFLALLRSNHHICLVEAVNGSGADLLMDGENIRLFSAMVAVLRGGIGIHLCQELDPDVSITWTEYQSGDTSHPPLTEDWEDVAEAALSSTRRLLECRDPDEETPLCVFIQSVVLSTLLQLFFGLPTTPTNTEEVIWIAGKTQRADSRHRNPRELSRLLKSSQNPSGVLTLLFAIRGIVLAGVCTLESGDEKLRFLRRAETLLRHPNTPDPCITRLVEKVKGCNPPVQLVHGGVLLESFPFCGTNEVEFFIPVDLLPPSACILGSGEGCASWLHKSALPSRPDCGGEQWLVQATAIILSAIETEMRRSHLTIDGYERGSESWEDWTLRRLRV
jgi:hypothetical protein